MKSLSKTFKNRLLKNSFVSFNSDIKILKLIVSFVPLIIAKMN